MFVTTVPAGGGCILLCRGAGRARVGSVQRRKCCILWRPEEGGVGVDSSLIPLLSSGQRAGRGALSWNQWNSSVVLVLLTWTGDNVGQVMC